MTDRPSGTVTFLFTDVEGSTQLWEKQPVRMRAALERVLMSAATAELVDVDRNTSTATSARPAVSWVRIRRA